MFQVHCLKKKCEVEGVGARRGRDGNGFDQNIMKCSNNKKLIKHRSQIIYTV